MFCAKNTMTKIEIKFNIRNIFVTKIFYFCHGFFCDKLEKKFVTKIEFTEETGSLIQYGLHLY